MNHLLQPKMYKSLMSDEGSKDIMEKTINFFENHMGKTKLTEDYWSRIWYREFLDFLKQEKIFYKLLTPKQYAEIPTAVGIRPETANSANFWPFTASATGTASR